jgi:hypothetical protein
VPLTTSRKAGELTGERLPTDPEAAGTPQRPGGDQTFAKTIRPSHHRSDSSG